jgi:hypothetical protein
LKVYIFVNGKEEARVTHGTTALIPNCDYYVTHYHLISRYYKNFSKSTKERLYGRSYPDNHPITPKDPSFPLSPSLTLSPSSPEFGGSSLSSGGNGLSAHIYDPAPGHPVGPGFVMPSEILSVNDGSCHCYANSGSELHSVAYWWSNK